MLFYSFFSNYGTLRMCVGGFKKEKKILTRHLCAQNEKKKITHSKKQQKKTTKNENNKEKSTKSVVKKLHSISYYKNKRHSRNLEKNVMTES